MPADSGHSQELKLMNVPVIALKPSHDPLSKGKNPSAQTVLGHLPQQWLGCGSIPFFQKMLKSWRKKTSKEGRKIKRGIPGNCQPHNPSPPLCTNKTAICSPFCCFSSHLSVSCYVFGSSPCVGAALAINHNRNKQFIPPLCCCLLRWGRGLCKDTNNPQEKH